MRKIETSSTFKKDLKRCAKRGLTFDKFDNVIGLLIRDEPLPARNNYPENGAAFGNAILIPIGCSSTT